ncbi:MAG TPA: alpha-hydroxy-acid oxidizing protein [Roseiarcus sp.]|nr:alpha-hydroxy-acid oxidizing protein [Roseiarcus sp.]
MTTAFIANWRATVQPCIPASAQLFWPRAKVWAGSRGFHKTAQHQRLKRGLARICHPDDARRAIDGGVDGIYCSNHGGRQANGGIPALDMLPAVVKAAGRVPVMFDSGIRSGTHIVKALAMGAAAVGVGRPYAYGLALGGTDGIVHVLRSLLAEADLLMAVNGYPTLADLRPETLQRVER